MDPSHYPTAHLLLLGLQRDDCFALKQGIDKKCKTGLRANQLEMGSRSWLWVPTPIHWLIPPPTSLPQFRSWSSQSGKTSQSNNLLHNEVEVAQPVSGWCNREVLEHGLVLPGQSKTLFKSGPLYPTWCNAHRWQASSGRATVIHEQSLWTPEALQFNYHAAPQPNPWHLSLFSLRKPPVFIELPE